LALTHSSGTPVIVAAITGVRTTLLIYRATITPTLGCRPCGGFSTAERLAGEEIDSAHIDVSGQLHLGRSPFVAIKALDDLAVGETYVRTELVKLCLQQSSADSRDPETAITARLDRQFALDNDVGQI
jgi:hypothetical protein